MYAENYKTLVAEVEKQLNKWRDMPCSWIGRLSIFKISNSPQNDKLNVIPIKISRSIFVEIKTLVVKYMWKGKNIE